jgi:hypothetical protein
MSDIEFAKAGSHTSEQDAELTCSTTPLHVHLAISDLEAIRAASDYPEGRARSEFIQTGLKIGVLPVRAARGVVDGDAIRKEGDGFDDIVTAATNSGNAAKRIVDRANLMKAEIGGKINSLGEQVAKLKEIDDSAS